jgi:hypothetical protein
MKILAFEVDTPGSEDEDFRPYLKDEARRAWELTQAGIIREAYWRQDEHSAVLVLECSGMDEARKAVESLPLVKAGLIEFQLIPLAPYDGFARLFGDER